VPFLENRFKIGSQSDPMDFLSDVYLCMNTDIYSVNFSCHTSRAPLTRWYMFLENRFKIGAQSDHVVCVRVWLCVCVRVCVCVCACVESKRERDRARERERVMVTYSKKCFFYYSDTIMFVPFLENRFKIGSQSDPMDFLAWLLSIYVYIDKLSMYVYIDNIDLFMCARFQRTGSRSARSRTRWTSWPGCYLCMYTDLVCVLCACVRVCRERERVPVYV